MAEHKMHDRHELGELEARLGVRFDNLELLSQALTHRSYLNEVGSLALADNERLEFLGDALVDYFAAALLFQRFPEAGEGDLTRLRSALVKESTLAQFACQLGLGQFVLLSRGETAAGGADRPSLLCDAFEAVVGAVYLDQGLEAARRLVLSLMEPTISLVLERQLYRDPRSQLQELTQASWQVTPLYETVAASGPDHAKRFTVRVLVNGEEWGLGEGSSKQEAAREAARDGLVRWGGRPSTGNATDPQNE